MFLGSVVSRASLFQRSALVFILPHGAEETAPCSSSYSVLQVKHEVSGTQVISHKLCVRKESGSR